MRLNKIKKLHEREDGLMRLELAETAKLLVEKDNILILTHTHPDGDTLGSGFALCYALRSVGKHVNVLCPDEIPREYSMITGGYEPLDFKPDFIVAVDVASMEMLGHLRDEYSDKINLCIDHHGSNTEYADRLFLNECAATAEMVFLIIKEMNIPVDRQISDCIYAGISTDTGCFKYSNTTSQTHRIAAELIDNGADHSEIDRIFFDTKTKSYAMLEKMALEGLQMYFDDRCAIITVTDKMIKKSEATMEDCSKLSPLTRQIEGVLIGATIREQEDGSYKASVRTQSPISASELCTKLGGGGHARAAGCSLHGTLEDVKSQLLDAIEEILNDRDNCD